MPKNKDKNIKRNIKTAVGAVITAGAMSLSLVATPKIVLAQETGCTFSDIVSYCAFEHELRTIKNDKNITFQNSELYNILKENAGGELTIEYLHSLTYLTLKEPLSNNDLSDLKYLPNLSRIEICGMTIDSKDLIYNQKLRILNVVDGSISNLNNLPNTIRELHLQGTTITDGVVYVPYETRNLDLNYAIFNKIHVKNSENLISFSFEGYSLLDLADLKDCTNLKYISMLSCPNVANSKLLNGLPKLTDITLDDFSCIWLDKETLDNLALDEEAKKQYLSFIEELDQIANNIILENKTEEEKLNAIIMYVTDKIDYDIRVSEEQQGYKTLITGYNKSPIYFALNKDVGICVNYACLFTALANRVGIDTYQPKSENHTWNMVSLENENDYSAYDLGGLDGLAIIKGLNGEITTIDIETSSLLRNNDTENLYYYGFKLEDIDKEDFETNIKPVLISNITKSLGYLRSNTLKAAEFQMIVLIIELLTLYIALNIKVHNDKRKDYQSVQTLKYKRV